MFGHGNWHYMDHPWFFHMGGFFFWIIVLILIFLLFNVLRNDNCKDKEK